MSETLQEMLARRKAEKLAQEKTDAAEKRTETKSDSEKSNPSVSESDNSAPKTKVQLRSTGKKTFKSVVNKDAAKPETKVVGVTENKLPVSTVKPSISKKLENVNESAAAEGELVDSTQSSELFELNTDIYVLEGFDSEKFIENMQAVSSRMDQEVPEIKVFIKEILLEMRRYEELAYLLNDNQIGLITGGVLKIKGIEIATPAKTSKTKKVFSLQNDEITKFF